MTSTSLTAINSFLLAFTWQGEPGFTYTVQTSKDLAQWNTLPYVFQGYQEQQIVTLSMENDRFFARLQFSDQGDSNENGLPDLWEWREFGYLDVDPDADPDGDVIPNHAEWLAGTDPRDYYNGDSSVVVVGSGREWIVRSGRISTQALALLVLDSSGEPRVNAPVHLRIDGGYAGLLQSDDFPESAVPELVAYTDHLGRIDPGSHDIHYLAPSDPGSVHFLRIETGGNATRILLRSVAAGLGQPPRMVRIEPGQDGTAQCSWIGDASGADRFLLDSLDVTGNWIRIADVSTAVLPGPDPASGRYLIPLPESL